VAYPEYWLYFLGALFIAVTLFLPEGIVGLVRKWLAPKHRAQGGAVATGDARSEAQRALAAGEGMEPEALPPAGLTAAVATAGSAGIETKGARA
jgi:urea transport system permease protein